MELRHLQSFIAVAEELSFRRAAERLTIAQAPLSQQIKRLEREVGAQLLHRTTRRVSLTAAGAAFLREARRAVEVIEEAPHAARMAAAGETGVLRLGVSGPTFYEVLVIVASRFRAQWPDIRLEISGPAYGGELIGKLDRDEIDACLVRLPVPGTGIVVRRITDHVMAAVLPDDHRLARQGDVRIVDLLAEPIVGYPSNRGSGTVTRIHSAFLEYGASPNIVLEAPDTHTIILMVAIGAGIGLVPVSAAHMKVPGVVFVPISDMAPLPLALAWRGDDRNPVLLALTGMLDEICADFE